MALGKNYLRFVTFHHVTFVVGTSLDSCIADLSDKKASKDFDHTSATQTLARDWICSMASTVSQNNGSSYGRRSIWRSRSSRQSNSERTAQCRHLAPSVPDLNPFTHLHILAALLQRPELLAIATSRDLEPASRKTIWQLARVLAASGLSIKSPIYQYIVRLKFWCGRQLCNTSIMDFQLFPGQAFRDVPTALGQLPHYAGVDDVAAVAVLATLTMLYLLRGVIWDKPDRFLYKMYERPQELMGGVTKSSESTRDIAQKLEQVVRSCQPSPSWTRSTDHLSRARILSYSGLVNPEHARS